MHQDQVSSYDFLEVRIQNNSENKRTQSEVPKTMDLKRTSIIIVTETREKSSR